MYICTVYVYIYMCLYIIEESNLKIYLDLVVPHSFSCFVGELEVPSSPRHDMFCRNDD